jgi:hypothetical protein
MNVLQLVSFSQAKRLKELGFDFELYAFYYCCGTLEVNITKRNNNDPFYSIDSDIYSAPTVALALKWFRDVKGLIGLITSVCSKGKLSHYVPFIIGKEVNLPLFEKNNYELAEKMLLDDLLTILENK